MQVTLGVGVTRRGVDETITGLWSFANALGLLVDDIGERTPNLGVAVDGLVIKDSGIPEAAVTAHEAALAILEGQIANGSILARIATAEMITGLYSFGHADGLKTDKIVERSADTGVTIDNLLVKDGGIPQAAVTAHEAALAILESQITDGTLLARLAAAETVTGAWRFDEQLDLRKRIFSNEWASEDSDVFDSRKTGDSVDRYARRVDGTQFWGPGDGALDTNLYRNAADELKTDDALTVALALTTEHDFIVPVLRELLGAQADNVNMVGKTIYYVDATGAQNISGFAGGVAGKIIAVVNRDATDTITLLHASGSSSAGNRMVFAGDASLALSTREAILLFYNTTDNDWRPLSGGTP